MMLGQTGVMPKLDKFCGSHLLTKEGLPLSLVSTSVSSFAASVFLLEPLLLLLSSKLNDWIFVDGLNWRRELKHGRRCLRASWSQNLGPVFCIICFCIWLSRSIKDLVLLLRNDVNDGVDPHWGPIDHICDRVKSWMRVASIHLKEPFKNYKAKKNYKTKLGKLGTPPPPLTESPQI